MISEQKYAQGGSLINQHTLKNNHAKLKPSQLMKIRICLNLGIFAIQMILILLDNFLINFYKNEHDKFKYLIEYHFKGFNEKFIKTKHFSIKLDLNLKLFLMKSPIFNVNANSPSKVLMN